MSDDVRTEAYRVLVSFNALTKNDTVHLPVPLDEHNQALVKMGLLAPVLAADDPLPYGPTVQGADEGTVMAVNTTGDTTTVLGVMPAPVANARRTRKTREQKLAELAAITGEVEGSGDGEADS